jgi:hypothetical protein
MSAAVAKKPFKYEESHSHIAKQAYNSNVNTDDYDPYAEMVKERSPYLFCDTCMYYPIEPVHGHFMCPACRNITKCCEGMPVEVENV